MFLEEGTWREVMIDMQQLLLHLCISGAIKWAFPLSRLRCEGCMQCPRCKKRHTGSLHGTRPSLRTLITEPTSLGKEKVQMSSPKPDILRNRNKATWPAIIFASSCTLSINHLSSSSYKTLEGETVPILQTRKLKLRSRCLKAHLICRWQVEPRVQV